MFLYVSAPPAGSPWSGRQQSISGLGAHWLIKSFRSAKHHLQDWAEMLMHRSELSFNLTSNRYLLILLFLPCNISGVSSLHYCFTTWELFKVTYVHLRVISTLQSHIL